MRDLAFLGFLLLMVLLAFKRPFLMTIAYLWVDIVRPQQVTYYGLAQVPLSLIMAILLLLTFLALDRQKAMRFGAVQALMVTLLLWVTMTTLWAILPEHAWIKWDSTWKAIIFGIYLPFVLTTRTRIEAFIAFMVCAVGAITISPAIKTLLGGGGYGNLETVASTNAGLFESSTLATFAFTCVPLILYVARSGHLFKPTRLTWMAAAGLIFSAAMVTVGTEARTGVVAGAMLLVLLFLQSRRKLAFAAATAAALALALPFAPESFKDRMATIGEFQNERSASTRLAMWQWTADYVADHPLGGGFGMYRISNIDVKLTAHETGEGTDFQSTTTFKDRARAFHSSYFEVLGEHGYPGLLIYLAMIGVAIAQLVGVWRRFRGDGDQAWLARVALAMLSALLVYLVGAAFVGIAFQPALYWLLGVSASIGFCAAGQAAGEKTPIYRPLARAGAATR